MLYSEFVNLICSCTLKINNNSPYKKIDVDKIFFESSKDNPFIYIGTKYRLVKQEWTNRISVYLSDEGYLRVPDDELTDRWKSALSYHENYQRLLNNISNYLNSNMIRINYDELTKGLKKFDTFINNFVKNNPFQKLDVMFLCKIGIFTYIQALANEAVLENPPKEFITILKNELAIYEKEKETEFLDQLKELSGNMIFLEAIFLENKELFSLDNIIIGIKNRTNLSELIGPAYHQFDLEYSKHFSFKTSLTDTSKMILTTLFLSPEEKQSTNFLGNVFETLRDYQNNIFDLKDAQIISWDRKGYYQINYFHREVLRDVCLTSDYNQNKELLELLVKKHESSDDLIRKQLLPIIIALIEKINFKYIETFRAMYCFRIIKTNYQINTEMMKKIQVWLSN